MLCHLHYRLPPWMIFIPRHNLDFRTKSKLSCHVRKMSMDFNFVLPMDKDIDAGIILPQAKLSSDKWSFTSIKRMAILDSLSENDKYIEEEILRRGESFESPIHTTSKRINNIFDSFLKKNPRARSSSKLSSLVPTVIDKDVELFTQRQLSNIRSKVTKPKSNINNRADNIYKSSKLKEKSIHFNSKPKSPLLKNYDSDDDFETKRPKKLKEVSSIVSVPMFKTKPIKVEQLDDYIVFDNQRSLLRNEKNKKMRSCKNLSPLDIIVIDSDEDILPEVKLISPTEIETIDINEDNVIQNQSVICCNSKLNDGDTSCIFLDEDTASTIEFPVSITAETLRANVDDSQLVSKANVFGSVDDEIHFTDDCKHLESFKNWIKQYKYLKYEESVSNGHYVNRDSNMQFNSLDGIIRLYLYDENLDYGMDGVAAIDSFLTTKMKMKNDLFLKSIDILLTVAEEHLVILCSRTIIKMISLYSWNFEDNLWRYFESVTKPLCDKDSSESVKNVSFQLFKLLLFIVSEIGINSLNLKENVFIYGTGFEKVKYIISWISSICCQFQLCEKYGKPFFHLLKYAMTTLEKSYMIDTVTEEMYSIVESLPNVFQRQYVIGLIEPKYLKLRILSLILEKNENLVFNNNDFLLNKSFSNRLINYFINAKPLKYFKYSEATVELLEKEAYEELVFILNSVVVTFLETVVNSSYTDYSLEMESLPAICESFQIFSDRIISCCSSISNYYAFQELNYLIYFTIKNYF